MLSLSYLIFIEKEGDPGRDTEPHGQKQRVSQEKTLVCSPSAPGSPAVAPVFINFALDSPIMLWMGREQRQSSAMYTAGVNKYLRMHL